VQLVLLFLLLTVLTKCVCQYTCGFARGNKSKNMKQQPAPTETLISVEEQSRTSNGGNYREFLLSPRVLKQIICPRIQEEEQEEEGEEQEEEDPEPPETLVSPEDDFGAQTRRWQVPEALMEPPTPGGPAAPSDPFPPNVTTDPATLGLSPLIPTLSLPDALDTPPTPWEDPNLDCFSPVALSSLWEPSLGTDIIVIPNPEIIQPIQEEPPQLGNSLPEVITPDPALETANSGTETCTADLVPPEFVPPALEEEPSVKEDVAVPPQLEMAIMRDGRGNEIKVAVDPARGAPPFRARGLNK
jgi:hypothetical protein